MPHYGVYVHLPWCRIRCPYCAFQVEVDPHAPFSAYSEALLRQWEAHAARFDGRPDTLAFGGGTPSLLPPADIARLVRAIAPSGEVSLEANPEDVRPDALEALRAAGVTRLSLGVQTFSPRFGRPLGRLGKVRELPAAVRAVATAGFRSWSADLMFALPGQSPDDFSADLDRLLEHDPPHVSLYGLTAEEGTPYARSVARGRFPDTDEDAWAEMVTRAEERLARAGLHRYEVSNFARPGHHSACNEHYWQDRPYAGLGAGAHGYLPDGRRTVGAESAERFLADPTAWTEETPTLRQRAIDLILSTLRHVEGLPRGRLEALGFGLDEAVVDRLVAEDLVKADPARVALVGRGWQVADAVTRRLVGSLRPGEGPDRRAPLTGPS